MGRAPPQGGGAHSTAITAILRNDCGDGRRIMKEGDMENWIGAGIWIILGIIVGTVVCAMVKVPGAQPGNCLLAMVFGAFGAVVGGMLGVGIFEFGDERALSAGGMIGALALSILMSWTYRWGSKSVV